MGQVESTTIRKAFTADELEQLNVIFKRRTLIDSFDSKCFFHRGSNVADMSFSKYCEQIDLLLHGSLTEIQSHLLQTHPNETLTDLVAQIASLALYRFQSRTSNIQATISHSFVNFLLKRPVSQFAEDIEHEKTDTNNFCELSEFSDWMETAPLAPALWKLATNGIIFAESAKDLVPSRLPELSQLVNIETLFMLEFSTQATGIRPDWIKLFSSSKDGSNWTLFLEKLTFPESLVLLIQDKDGNTFGAFSSSNLSPNPNFGGDSRCFVFTTYPAFCVYKPTGLNSNYAYLNHSTMNFPNGVGFGGQTEYFGLFLDSSFEKGESNAEPISTTFGNPRLSGKKQFEIESGMPKTLSIERVLYISDYHFESIKIYV